MGVCLLLPVIAGMGATAGIAVIAVLLCRCFLKRGPKLFCYLLWSVVLFRLLCPVSVPSAVSALRLFEFGKVLKEPEITALAELFNTLEGFKAGSGSGRGEERNDMQSIRAGEMPDGIGNLADKTDFLDFASWYANDFESERFSDLRLAWENRFNVRRYPAEEEKREEEAKVLHILPELPALFLEMGVPKEDVLAEQIAGNLAAKKDTTDVMAGKNGTGDDAEKNAASGRNSVPVWLAVATWVWFAGMGGMLLYALISMVCLKRRLVGAVRLKGNIFQSGYVASPFVVGVFAPKIYLPSALCGKEQEYILLHEQTHVRRGDHIFRLLAFAALVLHWFNPLVWLAFVLSGKDMEMACDEAVMKRMKEDIRAQYSASLLGLATGKHLIPGTYLAFGEGDVKSRIKNVMRYKKPTVFWMVFAVLLVSGTVCVFGSDPKEEKEILVQEEKEEGHKKIPAQEEREEGYKEIPAQTEKEEEIPDTFTIYSLSNSELVYELIAGFTARHPEIELCYETGEEGLSVPEQIDALTARLSAGVGPDLLILDGLPTEVYQSKGLLTDLAFALEPLKEELQQNILSACMQEGKLYMLPLCYLLPVVLAGEDGQEAAQSLHTLMQYAGEGDSEKKIHLESYSHTDLLEMVYYNYMPELVLPDGSVDEQELGSFLSDTKWLAQSLGIDGGKDTKRYFSEAYAEADFSEGDKGIWFAALDGADSLHVYASQTEENREQGRKLELLGGVFFPEGLIGVNAWSTKKELAGLFVQEIFSSEMQSAYAAASGFSTNTKAFAKVLENWNGTRADGAFGVFGEGEDFRAQNAVSESEKLAGWLEEITGHAVRYRMADAVILQILKEETADYLTGEQELEECVAAIAERLL